MHWVHWEDCGALGALDALGALGELCALGARGTPGALEWGEGVVLFCLFPGGGGLPTDVGILQLL